MGEDRAGPVQKLGEAAAEAAGSLGAPGLGFAEELVAQGEPQTALQQLAPEAYKTYQAVDQALVARATDMEAYFAYERPLAFQAAFRSTYDERSREFSNLATIFKAFAMHDPQSFQAHLLSEGETEAAIEKRNVDFANGMQRLEGRTVSDMELGEVRGFYNAAEDLEQVLLHKYTQAQEAVAELKRQLAECGRHVDSLGQ